MPSSRGTRLPAAGQQNQRFPFEEHSQSLRFIFCVAKIPIFSSLVLGKAVQIPALAPYVDLTFPVTSNSLSVQENHPAIIQVIVRANDLEGSVSQRLDE